MDSYTRSPGPVTRRRPTTQSGSAPATQGPGTELSSYAHRLTPLAGRLADLAGRDAGISTVSWHALRSETDWPGFAAVSMPASDSVRVASRSRDVLYSIPREPHPGPAPASHHRISP